MKWAMVAVISASTAFADVLQSVSMKDHGEIQDFRPQAVAGYLARLMRNRNMLAAVASLAVSFFAFLALISVSELSFAVPATAATYVLETILAKYLLGSMSTGAAGREQPWSPVAWLCSCCKVLRIARSLCYPLSFRFITKSRRFFLSTNA